MAGIGIATIAAIVGTAASAGGAAYEGVQASDAHDAAVDQRHAEQKQLYTQQKAAADANQQTQAKQASTVALARQRTLQAAGGGTWGGTLGTGAAGAGTSSSFQGGYKTALGA